MQFTLTINLDNDAFGKAPSTDTELARILSDFAKTCKHATLAPDHGRLYDVNGNRVGIWEVKE